MIEYLRRAGTGANAATLFLYCDYRDQVNQTFINMVGSLAQQLALQANPIPTIIWNLYKDMIKKRQPINTETLRTILNIFVQLFDIVYVGIDALDECQVDTRR